MTNTRVLAAESCIGRVLPMLLFPIALGCGTTRMSDTQRTATEQLLISNAVDVAVSQIDLRPLSGKPVFFDAQYLDGTVDKGYLVSSLRQSLLAHGCILQEERAKSTYVVEARSGAVGTDRHSLLVGVPQMTVPALVPGQPSQIPEIPFAKKTDEQGVAKIALFAYNRKTGQRLWQSGLVEATSDARDTWVAGLGPFRKGTIVQGTELAGEDIQLARLGDQTANTPKSATHVAPLDCATSWNEPPPSSIFSPYLESFINYALGGHHKAGEGPSLAAGSPASTAIGSTASSPDRPPPSDDHGPPTSVSTARPMPAPMPPVTAKTSAQADSEPSGALISGLHVKPDGY